MSKNKRKTAAALLLAAVMALGSIPVFGAGTFSDMDGSPYEDAVENLVSQGIINGYEDGTFRPQNTITRAEVCVVTTKAMAPGEQKLNEARMNGFPDVHSGYDWAKKYINYASAMGVIDGYPNGTFKPAGNVTYNELSAMVLKGMGYRQSELAGSWPLNFRNKALELGLYDGIYENMTKTQVAQMNYDAAATRGDAVLMITAGLSKLRERGKEALPGPDSHSYDDGSYHWIDGLPSSLSIQEAVDIMQHQGYLAEMAELNRKADEATAKGYADNVKTLKDGLDLLKVVDPETAMAMNKQGITKGNYEIAKLQKQFANDNIENNYRAELNSIEYQTVTLYYGVLQAQENLRVAEDNLAVQEEMLKNVQAKNKVGMAPNIEVTSQQNQVTSARQAVKDAKSAAENAKMNFNLLLGYSVTDNVALKDGLTPLPFPEMTLEEAISSAVANRLDNAQIEYAYELASVAMKYLRAGKKSTAYLTQENQLKQMELQLNNMPKTLEIEIRNDYIDLTAKYQAIQDAQEKLTLVKESFRAAKVMYDVGMNTLADVQSAQLTLYQTNQLLMKSIADYDIAVYEYEYATGLGKKRISF